jgi:hypothetical protein
MFIPIILILAAACSTPKPVQLDPVPVDGPAFVAPADESKSCVDVDIIVRHVNATTWVSYATIVCTYPSVKRTELCGELPDWSVARDCGTQLNESMRIEVWKKEHRSDLVKACAADSHCAEFYLEHL